MSPQAPAADTPTPPRLAGLRRHAGQALAVYWLALIAGMHWPGLQLELPRDIPLWAQLIPLDKVAHVLAFTGLTALIYLAWPARSQASAQTRAVLAAIVAGGYGLLSEYTQTHFAGRTFSHADLTANTIAVLGTYLALAPRGSVRRWQVVLAWVTRLACLLAAPAVIHLSTTVAGSRRVLGWYADWGWPESVADKRAHFYGAALAVILLSWARVAGVKRPQLSALIATLIVGLSAPLLEWRQIQEGRGQGFYPEYFAFPDMYAHQRGLLLALSLWALSLAVWQARRGLNQAAGVVTGLGSPPPERDDSFVGHAALVSGLTLLSRLTGLVRDAVLAAVFGLTWIADSFFVAFLIPNLFRRLFGEGALTAAFIPRYSQLREHDPDLARRFATACTLGVGLILTAIVLLGELVLAMLATGDWDQSPALTIRLAQIMLPYMPLVCGVAFVGAVLQVHGRFGPPAAAPVLLNLVLIGTAVAVGYGATRPHDHQGAILTTAHALAWAVLAAGALQLVWQLAALSRCVRPALGLAGTAAPVRQMLVTMIPMLIGLGVFQINALMDTLIAWGLSPSVDVLGLDERTPMQTGDVAALQWSQRLYQFPLGVFGIAIATAIFPALSRAAARDTGFTETLRQGLRLTVFIGLPASAGLVIVALPMTRLIYEHGTFDLADARRVAFILTGYAVSVWAYSLTHVLTRAFYAKDDPKTPLRVSLALVGCNLVLNLILIWPLGAAGLAWSSAACAAAQSLILLRLIRRYVDDPADTDVWRSWRTTAAWTALMAAVLVPVVMWADVPSLTGPRSAVVLFAVTALGALIILGGAWATKRQELRWVTRRSV